MTIQIVNNSGTVMQFVPSEVRYIGMIKGRDIDKWDMRNNFIGFDMNDIRAGKTYLEVAVMPNLGKYYFTDECVAMFKEGDK